MRLPSAARRAGCEEKKQQPTRERVERREMQSPLDPAMELAARKLWTLRWLGERANRGKSAGWIDGDAYLIEHLEHPRLDHGDTPMRLMQHRLGLTQNESDTLWLLACIELDPLLARAMRCLASPGMHELNVQTLEHVVLEDPSSVARLERLALLEVGGDERTPLFRRPVRPNDHVLDLARGTLNLDRSVERIARLSDPIAASASSVRFDLDRALASRSDVLILARGASGSGRAALLVAAARACDMKVIRVEAARLQNHSTLERQVQVLAREALFHDALLILEDADELVPRHREIEHALHFHKGAVAMTVSRSTAWNTHRTVISLDVSPPREDERRELWRNQLPQAGDEVIDFAARYRIGSELIAQTAGCAVSRARCAGNVTVGEIRRTLSDLLAQRFGGSARRIETKQTWKDLVLPIDQLELLLELVARVRYRSQVVDTWGFGDKVGRGLGLAALLSGPPGTGKTMIGGLLAKELELDLYQVDLSQVVSKYIGETEKQLGAVFDAAEAGNAIILFDEADSLFAKRTEVKSSNDRYANLEVNYLLQRIESFAGICLMTTNHEHGIDPAFQRRLAAHIRIPMPDREQRERIWRAMVPAAAEVQGDLDFNALAELRMSGGFIKNAVLRSAYIAASNGSAITNEYLWKAARLEYEASGKLMCEG